uniref:GG14583 n=1 Tax=Drosophila erecta TaxID=7220 RepID=B3P013_DROER
MFFVSDRRRYSKKLLQFDGPAEFNLAAHRRPRLIIANEHFIVHRILGKDNLIGSWRCMYHHKGCKARASTFMVDSEVKYRSTCSSHNHKNVRAKLQSLKMPWVSTD